MRRELTEPAEKNFPHDINNGIGHLASGGRSKIRGEDEAKELEVSYDPCYGATFRSRILLK